MNEEQRELYRKYMGRDAAPAAPFVEGYLIAGRRSGKSLTAALIATYLAAFKTYDDVLTEGEVGTLMVIASDKKQARVIFNYIRAFLPHADAEGLGAS